VPDRIQGELSPRGAPSSVARFQSFGAIILSKHGGFATPEGPVAQRLEQGTHNLSPAILRNFVLLASCCKIRTLAGNPTSPYKAKSTATRYSIRYSRASETGVLAA